MYATFYPYAVQVIAVLAAVGTIIMGLYGAVTIIKAAPASGTVVGEGGYGRSYYIFGATAMFVGACVAAMVELRIGVWISSACQ